MCGRNQSPVIFFALRAIAAGAGGEKLAVWALEEAQRDEKERMEAERMSFDQMKAIFEDRKT